MEFLTKRGTTRGEGTIQKGIGKYGKVGMGRFGKYYKVLKIRKYWESQNGW